MDKNSRQRFRILPAHVLPVICRIISPKEDLSPYQHKLYLPLELKFGSLRETKPLVRAAGARGVGHP